MQNATFRSNPSGFLIGADLSASSRFRHAFASFWGHVICRSAFSVPHARILRGGRCPATALRAIGLNPRTQTLIAETIKLCDIADTLGRFSPRKEGCMKLAGFLLLLAGWA